MIELILQAGISATSRQDYPAQLYYFDGLQATTASGYAGVAARKDTGQWRWRRSRTRPQVPGG